MAASSEPTRRDPDSVAAMPVRDATDADLEVMLVLADRRRRLSQRFAPVFHRPAADAVRAQRPWFSALIADAGVGSFVYVDDAGTVDGFLVATLVEAPPVYDPGGLTCSIDDFVVAEESQWRTAGLELLSAARRWSVPRGAVQTVVVSGAGDLGKRELLRAAGLRVVSEWFSGPADDD